MIRFLSILVVIFLTGCGVNLQKSSNNMPSWYLNPPTSNEISFYATGEGDSKKAAKAEALAAIAAEISTSVSSSIKIAKESLNNNGVKSYSNKVEQNTKAEVKKIDFSGARITKSAYVNNRFLVLVSVDRDELFNNYKSKVDNLFSKIQNKYRYINQNGFIAYLKNKTSFEKLVNEYFAKVAILKSVKPNFNDKSYYDRVSKLNYNLKVFVSHTKVYVKALNKDSLTYKRILEKYIATLGVKIQKGGIVVNLKIDAEPIEVNARDPRLRGTKWARVTIYLKVLSHKTELSSNVIEVKNGTRGTYKDAVIKTKKFEREIKRRGIANILIGN